MEGGGEQEEHKHVCKVCRKSFPCGRSLGGHMRSHVEVRPPSHPPPPPPQSSRGTSVVGGGGGGGGPGYGLRENPKKTWRIYESIGVGVSSEPEKLCRECGKGFPSWRAVFGHMRSHSAIRPSPPLRRLDDPERPEVAGQRGPTEETEEEEEDGEEEDEEEGGDGSWRGRSGRPAAAISEMERELEDVALCLMMLSRDAGFWGAADDSSHKGGSPVLEVVGGLTRERNPPEKGLKKDPPPAVGYISFRHPVTVLKRTPSDTDLEEDDPSDGGYGGGTPQRPRPRRVLAELGKRRGAHDGDWGLGKNSLSKKRRSHLIHAQLGKGYVGDRHGASFPRPPPLKKSRFECTTCWKTFHSYQALGGHRASHKRVEARFAPKLDGGEDSAETAASPADADKVLDVSPDEDAGRHECGICFKVFPSGQALGGHKRLHFVASPDASGVFTPHRQQLPPPPLPPGELDLNIPASPDGDSAMAGGRAGVDPWWVGSSHQRQPLVRL